MMSEENFIVHLFDTEARNSILKFSRKFDRQTRARIMRGISLLKLHGKNAGMPDVKKIDKELYELRIRGNTQLRFLFCQHGKVVHILHAFKKKTRKLPQKELRLAKKRLTNI